jgi:hypothetical protein
MLHYSRAVRPSESISASAERAQHEIGFATERLLKTKAELASLVPPKKFGSVSVAPGRFPS